MTNENTPTDIDSLIKEYCCAFSTAESHLKRAEYSIKNKTIHAGIIIPAINELRYAGCHVMRTFDPDISESDKKENFQKAINHCERASYDILDAQILFYVDICKIFREDYKLIVISNIIHDFLEDCRKIEDIMELLKNTRDKKTYSQQIEKSLEEISTISKKWEIAREELNKTLNDAINKNWQSFIITVRNVIGLFGTGIAFGMVIWKFCFK